MRHSSRDLSGLSPGAGRRGFTMMELVVVVIIVAVMFAVSLPTLRGVSEGNRLRADVREIMNLMKYARNEAVFKGHTTQVFLDTNNRQFWLDLRTPDPKTGRYDPRAPKSTMERKRDMETGVWFAAIDASDTNILKDDIVAVDFYPDGTASTTLVNLQNRRNASYTIEVMKSTGLVRLLKKDIEGARAESGNIAYPLPPNYNEGYSAAGSVR